MALVAPIDRDEVGRHRLDLTAVAEAAGENASHTGDSVGKCLHDIGRLAVIAEDEDVGVDRLDALVEEQNGRDVMEGADDAALSENGCSLLRR